MYDNRLLFSRLYGSDSAFFVYVLFDIDSALQIHWRSCCNNDSRMSVNNKLLFIQEQQDMLLHHNFVQQLPKSIIEKISDSSDKNGFNQGSKHNGKFKQGIQEDGAKEEGKTICMKLFLRGFCDKSCPRVHKLSPDDENAFYKFVIDCRTANEGALKPNF